MNLVNWVTPDDPKQRRKRLLVSHGSIFAIGLILSAGGVLYYEQTRPKPPISHPAPVTGKYLAFRVKQGGKIKPNLFVGLQGRGEVLQLPDGIALTDRSTVNERVLHSLQSEDGTPIQQVLATYQVGNRTVVDTKQVIAKFKPNVSEGTVRETLGDMGTILERLEANRYLIRVAENQSTLDLANKLSEKQDLIAYASANFISIVPPRPAPTGGVPGPAPQAPPNAFPDDVFFPMQWSLKNVGRVGAKRDADVHILPVWQNNIRGSEDVKIAILDEGVDEHHPDLQGKIVHPFDATKDRSLGDPRTEDDSQQPDIWSRHGTAAAGIAAAIPNNHKGIAGIAWNAKLIPIRVARTTACDDPWSIPWTTVASGVIQAKARGADVISLSLGQDIDLSEPEVKDLTEALRDAVTNGRGGKGIVVIAASGDLDQDHVDFPASLAGDRHTPLLPIIAVGATNENDERVSMPKYRWGSSYGKALTVVAPGVNIYTTDIHKQSSDRPAIDEQRQRCKDNAFSMNDYVTSYGGTSASTPLVAGVAALILSKHPEWTAKQVRDQIASTADHLGVPGDNDEYGYGRVNACRALELTNCDSGAPGHP